MQIQTNAPQTQNASECLKQMSCELASMLERGELCPVNGDAYFHIAQLIASAKVHSA